MKKIPDIAYKEILRNMPICCVDGLLRCRDGFFLFKRKYEPAKDQWWLFGGRLCKGESLKDAIIRKAKEELGIDIKVERQIGVYETVFEKNRYGFPVHTINIAYLVTSSKMPDFSKADYREFSEIRVFREIGKDIPDYVRQVIKDSGIIK